jgi:hypothetical protein
MYKSSLSLIFYAFLSIHTARATNCKGCTPLDELTFDKMVKERGKLGFSLRNSLGAQKFYIANVKLNKS